MSTKSRKVSVRYKYFHLLGCPRKIRENKKAEVIAYDDLGAEAIRRLEVEDFPAIVIIDSLGNNLYESGRANYLAQK